jgi:hypothetical protein
MQYVRGGKISEMIYLLGGKIHCGAAFWGFCGPIASGPAMRQSNLEEMRGEFLVRQLGSRERQGPGSQQSCQGHAPSDLTSFD